MNKAETFRHIATEINSSKNRLLEHVRELNAVAPRHRLAQKLEKLCGKLEALQAEMVAIKR